MSGSPGALLASRTALLSAPVGSQGIFEGESWAAGRLGVNFAEKCTREMCI